MERTFVGVEKDYHCQLCVLETFNCPDMLQQCDSDISLPKEEPTFTKHHELDKTTAVVL